MEAGSVRRVSGNPSWARLLLFGLIVLAVAFVAGDGLQRLREAPPQVPIAVQQAQFVNGVADTATCAGTACTLELTSETVGHDLRAAYESAAGVVFPALGSVGMLPFARLPSIATLQVVVRDPNGASELRLTCSVAAARKVNAAHGGTYYDDQSTVDAVKQACPKRSWFLGQPAG